MRRAIRLAWLITPFVTIAVACGGNGASTNAGEDGGLDGSSASSSSGSSSGGNVLAQYCLAPQDGGALESATLSLLTNTESASPTTTVLTQLPGQSTADIDLESAQWSESSDGLVYAPTLAGPAEKFSSTGSAGPSFDTASVRASRGLAVRPPVTVGLRRQIHGDGATAVVV